MEWGRRTELVHPFLIVHDCRANRTADGIEPGAVAEAQFDQAASGRVEHRVAARPRHPAMRDAAVGFDGVAHADDAARADDRLGIGKVLVLEAALEEAGRRFVASIAVAGSRAAATRAIPLATGARAGAWNGRGAGRGVTAGAWFQSGDDGWWREDRRHDRFGHDDFGRLRAKVGGGRSAFGTVAFRGAGDDLFGR